MATTLTPYLSFGGNTREAFAFYQQALGATIQVMLSYVDMLASEAFSEGCGDVGVSSGDGIKVDEDGNIWAGWGSTTNAPGALSADMDGVIVLDPGGKMIGQIHLPERCANLCFGGAKRNRLFMAASHSLYALYVETRGAV